MTFNLFRTDLSPYITSYDVLKTVAIILMVIDHLGHFFYPDIEELRLIGRLSAPIFFFLIGYASTYKLELRLWIWGVILLGGTWVMKDYYDFFPLNILFTFLAIRAFLPRFMPRIIHSQDTLFGGFWLGVLLIIPSLYLFEYGSFGLLFAMCGYLARRIEHMPTLTSKYLYLFMCATICTYTIGMWNLFDFQALNTVLLLVLLCCLSLILILFKPAEFKPATKNLSILKYPIFLTGRRTLEIYVLHFLAMQYIATYG